MLVAERPDFVGMIFLLVGEMVKRGGEYFFVGKHGFFVGTHVFFVGTKSDRFGGYDFCVGCPIGPFSWDDIFVDDQQELHSGGGNCCW